MLDVVNFIINSILYFINSLRNIVILGTNINLLTYYVSIIMVTMLVTFVTRFFRMERNIYNKSVNSQYFKFRNNLVESSNQNKINKTHTTKYLQNYRRK